MTRNGWIFSSVVLAFCSLAKADTVAPITSVVLYPGSASIERTAPVAAGSGLLEIKGLPNNFDTKTLLIQADRGIRVGQVVIQEAGKSDGAHPREKELQKKIRELKDQLDTQDIETKSAGLVTSYLDRVNGGEKGSADGKSVVSIAESIENTAARAYQRAQRAEIRKRQIKEDLDRAEFELSQFQSGAKNSRSISVQTVAE